MKNNKDSQSKLLIIGLLLVSLSSLVISPLALADKKVADNNVAVAKQKINKEAKQTTHKQHHEDAIKQKYKEQKALLKKIDRGFSEAVRQVDVATTLISENKEDEAIKLLTEASGKFDIALANDPDISLIPVASEIDLNVLNESIGMIKASVKSARKLLDHFEIQAAREILLPLVDELKITTTYLPMTTYPESIKQATQALVKGDKDNALEILSELQSTLVVDTSIIPLSIIRAESMIIEASELKKESKKAAAIALMKEAERQLELATILGYAPSTSTIHHDIFEEIKTLRKEIEGKNEVEKLYIKLKQSIKTLMHHKAKDTLKK